MILDGRKVAGQIKVRLTDEVSRFSFRPKLAIINVSSDPQADIYTRMKQKFGLEIGVEVEILRPELGDVVQTIERLNREVKTQGIIVQLPLPEGFGVAEIVVKIDPKKDVDGLGERTQFLTAGPRGILELLEAYEISLVAKLISIVGTGRLIGGPLGRELDRRGLEHQDFDLEHPIDVDVIRQSDLIISSTEVQGVIKSEWVKAGTVVIDVTGVDIESALLARDDIWITPPTGGVGPMTVAALFENLVEAAVGSV